MTRPAPLDDAVAAVEVALIDLGLHISGEGPAPHGLPADCCGECPSCEAGVAVSAAWPVFLAAALTELRAVPDVDVLTAATWLERDLSCPPTERN